MAYGRVPKFKAEGEQGGARGGRGAEEVGETLEEGGRVGESLREIMITLRVGQNQMKPRPPQQPQNWRGETGRRRRGRPRRGGRDCFIKL